MGRTLGTVLAIVVCVAGIWSVRRAGNALREMLKGGKK